MGALFALASSSFKLLLRDKVFLPVVLVGMTLGMVSVIVSDWSVEDFTMIVTQVALLGFHITGVVVSLIWGSRIISELHQKGVVESQMVTPISRFTWLMGNFLGLVFALIVLWVILISMWQGLLLMNRFDWLDAEKISVLALQGLLWIVVAALVFFFGTFCGPAVTLFAAASAWLMGLTTAWAKASIGMETPPHVTVILDVMSKFWDLSRLNLANHVYAGRPLPMEQVAACALYGLSIVVVLMIGGGFILEKKDITG